MYSLIYLMRKLSQTKKKKIYKFKIIVLIEEVIYCKKKNNYELKVQDNEISDQCNSVYVI